MSREEQTGRDAATRQRHATCPNPDCGKKFPYDLAPGRPGVRRVVVECVFCGLPVSIVIQTIDVTGCKTEEVDPAGNLAPGVPLRSEASRRRAE